MKNKTVNYSLEVLKLIIDQDILFSIAIKNLAYTKKLDPKTKSDVSALVGSALRHFAVIQLLIDKHFGELEPSLSRSLMLYIANYLFVKRLDSKELINELREDFEGKGLPFNSKFFENLTPNDLSFLSEEEKDTIKGWSIRNNLPEWLVGMWFKQYGERIGGLIVRGLHKQSNYCYVNKCEISKEDFLKTYPDFADTSLDGVVKYSGNTSLLGTKAIEDRMCFGIQPGDVVAFEKMDIDPMMGFAILGARHNSIHLIQAANDSHLTKMTIVSPESTDFYKYKKSIAFFDLKNVELINSKASLETCLSQPVKTLLVLPENTNFRSFMNHCDYFLHCKQEMIDEYLAKQNAALEDAAPLVIEGGQLIYMVNTINKKETMTMVMNFLKNHPEYELESHKQFLPFDHYQTCMYYAIMRKKTND